MRGVATGLKSCFIRAQLPNSLRQLDTHLWLQLGTSNCVPGRQVVKDAVQLARLEGLEGHARAAEKRLTNGKQADQAASPAKKPRK